MPVSTVSDVTALLPTQPRMRRAIRLRLVSICRRGWALILGALLDQAPLPMGGSVPEPWPAVTGLEEHAPLLPGLEALLPLEISGGRSERDIHGGKNMDSTITLKKIYPRKRCLLWCLGLVLGASLFYGLGTSPLREYRETIYAASARAMLTTPTPLVPHLNGTPHLDKPPLVAWLVTLSFWIGGIHEVAARMPSVLAILWTACVVGWLTRRICGPGPGLLAAIMFLGTPAAQYYGRMLMTDTIFVALTCTAMAALLEGYLRAHRGWYRLGFAVCGLAVMTRGLHGAVYPLGTLVGFCLYQDRSALRRVPWFSGTLLLLGVAAPWFALMEWRYPGTLYLFFVQHHLHRLNPTSLHTFVALPRWQILAAFAGLMGPSLLFLPWALATVRGVRATHGVLWLLAAGVLASVLLATGRNHPYTLPALPLLVALAAAWLSTLSPATSRAARRFPAGGVMLYGCAVLGALYWLEPILSSLSPLLTDVRTYETLQVCLILVAGLILLGGLCLWQGRGYAAGAALAMVMLPGAVLLLHVQHQLAAQESRASLAAVVARNVPPTWPIIIANPRDHFFEGVGAWGFYAQRAVQMVAFQTPVNGPFWSMTRPAWVLELPDIQAIWNTGQPFALVATSTALAHLPLPSLPAPHAQDGKFQLWILPPRVPAELDASTDRASSSPGGDGTCAPGESSTAWQPGQRTTGCQEAIPHATP